MKQEETTTRTVYLRYEPVQLPPVKDIFLKEPSKRTYYKASRKKRGKQK